MRKRDLLRWLEPYTDDAQIFVEEDMGLLSELQPRYVGPRQAREVKELGQLPDDHTLDEGEAFLVL